MSKRKTIREFIEEGRNKHKNFYSYPAAVYTDSSTKLAIKCPEHGEFWQTPNKHLRGRGCPSCANILIGKKRKDNQKDKRPDLSHIETPEGSKAVPVGTKGDYALVDDEDYERVMEHNWTMGSHGYAYNHKLGLLHRFIADTPPGMVTDHKTHDVLDNRKQNLRVCTYADNNKNQRKGTRKMSSIYKGVSLFKANGTWTARIKPNKNSNSKNLGYFKTEIEAAIAYDEAAKKYHKEFACLNFPSE